jgi:carbonic anhydrase/acetyltransferase-like protein (isoleucine patch superfamily)
MPIFPHNGVWPTIAKDVFIAPGAMIIGDVTLHEGVSIWYNAVLRADSAPIVVGRDTNIQDNCTLHVDADAPLTIGEACTIGHNAVVHGATLADHILVGMQAVVLSHAHIDAYTVLGACALVSEGKHVPEGKLAIGVPARPMRDLTSTERSGIVLSAQHYAQLANSYMVESLPDRDA